MILASIHPFIEFFAARGVPEETVVILLLFPLIATLVVFLRQVIGLQAFGIYTPSLITVAFLDIGIKYGIAVFAVVVAVGMLMRYALKKLRLLYLSRVAITMTIVCFSVLIVLAIGGFFERTGFATVDVFPLLIIISLVEKFVAVQLDKDTKTALFLAVETLLIAIIGYSLMSPTTTLGRDALAFIITYPYVVFAVIPINIFLGRWTGLRLMEYYRFHDILKKLQ